MDDIDLQQKQQLCLFKMDAEAIRLASMQDKYWPLLAKQSAKKGACNNTRWESPRKHQQTCWFQQLMGRLK